jgi:iron(III) transport system ATP-binding protein
MTKAIIQFKNITKLYNGAAAVADVSFSVARGTMLTLLGPSGCGKTTTLRLIAGIQRPDSGEISLNERVVAGHTWVPPEERRVGLVFQDYALFPHLSVQDNIAFGLQQHPRPERLKRVQELLALVGLAGRGTQMPFELSGGQQQRVALARALAPQPDIMLLDEPFSNLDTALRAQVRAEVRSILQAAGTTTIFVTHDQEEALSLSDQVAVMFQGRIVQLDTPQTLYTRPADPTIARFIGEANFLPATANGQTAESVFGTLQLVEPQHGAIQVLLRPEMLRLTHDAGTSAVIRWREYYGHSQRYGITLSDGTPLVVRASATLPYPVGATVRVQVKGAVMGYR